MAGIGGDYTMNIFLEREEETKHPAFEGEMGLYTLVALGRIRVGPPGIILWP